jgi:hypothetical protein
MVIVSDMVLFGFSNPADKKSFVISITDIFSIHCVHWIENLAVRLTEEE